MLEPEGQRVLQLSEHGRIADIQATANLTKRLLGSDLVITTKSAFQAHVLKEIIVCVAATAFHKVCHAFYFQKANQSSSNNNHSTKLCTYLNKYKYQYRSQFRCRSQFQYKFQFKQKRYLSNYPSYRSSSKLRR